MSTFNNTHITYLVAFYVLLAVLYAVKAPKWIPIILLASAISYLVWILITLVKLNTLLNNLSYPNVTNADDCKVQNTLRACGIWSAEDKKCFIGAQDSQGGCGRMGVPPNVFYLIGGMIALNLLLVWAFVVADKKRGGKSGKRRK